MKIWVTSLKWRNSNPKLIICETHQKSAEQLQWAPLGSLRGQAALGRRPRRSSQESLCMQSGQSNISKNKRARPVLEVVHHLSTYCRKNLILILKSKRIFYILISIRYCPGNAQTSFRARYKVLKGRYRTILINYNGTQDYNVIFEL